MKNEPTFFDWMLGRAELMDTIAELNDKVQKLEFELETKCAQVERREKLIHSLDTQLCDAKKAAIDCLGEVEQFRKLKARRALNERNRRERIRLAKAESKKIADIENNKSDKAENKKGAKK